MWNLIIENSISNMEFLSQLVQEYFVFLIKSDQSRSTLNPLESFLPPLFSLRFYILTEEDLGFMPP